MDRVRRILFQRSFRQRDCDHVDQVSVLAPAEPVCPDCVEEGTKWVHVRMCLVCGHPGCCDSSKPQHARAHHEETGHPLIRSVEPGESWGWCYLHEAYLTIDQYRP